MKQHRTAKLKAETFSSRKNAGTSFISAGALYLAGSAIHRFDKDTPSVQPDQELILSRRKRMDQVSGEMKEYGDACALYSAFFETHTL